MGGRGGISFSSKNTSGGIQNASRLDEFAVADLNTHNAKGASMDTAIVKFYMKTRNEKKEYSAYIDNNGYVHALASSGKEGKTGVIPASKLKNEKGKETVIHNHPHGGSRKYGGPLSSADYTYIAAAYIQTKGQVKQIIATSNEGVYRARVVRKPSVTSVKAAAKRAETKTASKKYSSEKALWKAYNDNSAKELLKQGIVVTFTPFNHKSSDKLVTQKIRTGV